MRKHHFFFGFTAVLLMGLCLAACNSTPKGYTIDGTAEGTVDGDTVLLCEIQGLFNILPLDTAIIADGKFHFAGEQEGAILRFVLPIHEGTPTTYAQIILENAAFHLNLKKGSDVKHDIEGGPSTALFAQYEDSCNAIAEQMNEPWALSQDTTQTEEARAAAEAQVDSLQAVLLAYQKQFIIDNMPSALSDMLFGYNQSNFSEEDQEELFKLLGEKQPDYPFYKALLAEREAAKATEVGREYTDIELNGVDGKPMKVSTYVAQNKYVLIDFWASWCGPCRAEMPTVVQAYTDYHDKGFEVVGVSLDNDKEAWLKAIKDLNMPWPQMSDLKGWESAGAALYNVRSIPANVLVDQQGKIVAKDLRGEDLLNKMAELLAND